MIDTNDIEEEMRLHPKRPKFTHIAAKQYLQERHEGYDIRSCYAILAKLSVQFWHTHEKIPGKEVEEFHLEYFFGHGLGEYCQNLSKQERHDMNVSSLFVECLINGKNKPIFESWLRKRHTYALLPAREKKKKKTKRIRVESVLQFAAFWGIIEVVEALCDPQADGVPERVADRALFFAQQTNRTEVAAFLLQRFQGQFVQRESILTSELGKKGTASVGWGIDIPPRSDSDPWTTVKCLK